ncbi:MAG TPA: cysteine desulfurase-like protein [Chloroflexota bacterium]
MIDAARVRERFPSLQRRQNDQPVLYFDNPAGTQVPRDSIDGYARYLECHNANVGGEFATSRETHELIGRARRAMADFLGAASPEEIVFGPNMTSLTFDLSHALARTLHPGDEVVTTRLEHDANVAPWLALEERGVTVRWVEVDTDTMTLDMRSAEQVIGPRTRLVACGYASNAFGTINDVRRMGELAHAAGALLFVDAVHYAPHGPIDVQALGCDLLVCSAYKFFGPHLGILFGRYDVLDRLPTYRVRPAGDRPPGKWETGTQNFEALGALLGTLAYLGSLAAEGGEQKTRLRAAMETINRTERGLSERLIAGLQTLPDIRICGITDRNQLDRRVPTVSFAFEGREPEDVARALGERGIFSWAGNHYAVEPMRRLGVDATQRVGLVHYNLSEEIDRFVEALDEILATTPATPHMTVPASRHSSDPA